MYNRYLRDTIIVVVDRVLDVDMYGVTHFGFSPSSDTVWASLDPRWILRTSKATLI